MEQWYGPDATWPVEAFKAWKDEQIAQWEVEGAILDNEAFEKNYGLGLRMLTGYAEHYGLVAEQPENDGLVVLCVEQEFQVPIPGTDGYFVGRMDGLAVDSVGRFWVLENKTAKSFPDPDELQMNQQILSYTWAANLLAQAGILAGVGVPTGARVWGAVYNGLRKHAPGPRTHDPVFMRRQVMHTTLELQIHARHLFDVYLQMESPHLRIYQTVSDACGWCSFRTPCMARMTGDDEKWLLKRNYRTAPARGTVYANGEE